MADFERYLGIDYSGAQTPASSLKGLRLYMAGRDASPVEVPPPPGPKKFWTRQGLAEHLVTNLREGPRTLVGIDHGFSFPLRYFETHHLPPDWDRFLDDFCEHWPTDDPHTYVDFVRDGLRGRGAEREGRARWRRHAEERCRAKSVFHFDCPGSVAKSTHAGLPWLRHLRRELGDRLHFWPFDGWTPPPDRSVVAEVYPSLHAKGWPCEDRTQDQQDAWATARWLAETDAAGRLPGHFEPFLGMGIKREAEVEGWILGVA